MDSSLGDEKNISQKEDRGEEMEEKGEMYICFQMIISIRSVNTDIKKC